MSCSQPTRLRYHSGRTIASMDRLEGDDDAFGMGTGASESRRLLRAIDELRELDRAQHLAVSTDDEVHLADRAAAKAREIFRMVKDDEDEPGH